jgi:hydroxyacylglutathione hydrolase
LSATSNIRLITAEQLHEKNEHSSGHMVINVLGEDAYAACHIQGSINVPFDRLATTAASWQKNKEIIVYCSSAQCSASKKAYALLVGLGFINVYEYAGGMKEWREKGLPVGGTCVAG